MNVLVVDDNEFVADSLAFLLDCIGHRAVMAHDGETALELLHASAFELVFLDETRRGRVEIRLSRNTRVRSAQG
ncbi:hypothetical protein [Paraburkholderia sp. MM6662-R1]|uniref:hypothetical protein n=1 Tax=Paraburkholderia sp. MM6662-R1 TaxID=2991066 RepID=UPI003D1F401F